MRFERLAIGLVSLCALALGCAPDAIEKDRSTEPRVGAGADPESAIPALPTPPGGGLPGWNLATPEQVTSAEAASYYASQMGASGASGASVASAAAAAAVPAVPNEVVDLARALGNTVDRIYEYVFDQITFTPTWGLKKSPLATILDRSGNAFEQSNLMVSLLNSAGYTADLVSGQVKLTGADVTSWLGVSNVNLVLNLLEGGGIPVASYTYDSSSLNVTSLAMSHVWVEVTGKNLGTTVYQFDPARKQTTVVAPSIDLATALTDPTTSKPYDRATLRAVAGGVAGDVAGSSLKGFAGAALITQLQQYATGLNNVLWSSANWFKSLDELLGGVVITPIMAQPALRQTGNPVRDASVTPTAWATVPNAYRTTLRFRLDGIDTTLFADAISGSRLTIVYDSTKTPTLYQNGAVLQKATAAGAAAGDTLTIDINEPYAASSGTMGDESKQWTLSTTPGFTYAVMNGFGTTGRDSVEFHRRKAQTALGTNAAGSEAVLGESLAQMADLWLAQRSFQSSLVEHVTHSYVVNHHTIGIAGQTQAPYVDIRASFSNVVTPASTSTEQIAAFFASGGFGSGFESATIEETQSVPGISTVALFQVANDAGDTFYEATSANWATIKAKLPTLGYTPAAVDLASSFISQGYRVILPGNGALGKGSWKGDVFLGIAGNGHSIAFMINGAKGGFSSQPIPADTAATNIVATAPSPTQSGASSSTAAQAGDPVAMATGDFVHRTSDLSVGTSDAMLTFERTYNSGADLLSGPMGRGWGHNFDIRVEPGSDALQGLGEDSAIDAAAMITAMYVAQDLLRADQSLATMVVASLVEQWGTHSLVNNMVTVKSPVSGADQEFIRTPHGLTTGGLPNFWYHSPPGDSAQLTHPSGYKVTAKDQTVSLFNADGTIASVVNPNGVGLTFAYASGQLTSVTHSYGWKLALTYDANGLVDKVSDGTRSVTYLHDAHGNLTSATDPRSEVTTYSYVKDGKLKSIFYPSSASAFVTNTYDSDTYGRIRSQLDANGHNTNWFIAGSRSIMTDAAAQETEWFFDRQSAKPVRVIDPLGHVTTYVYDAQQNLVSAKLPGGQGTSLVYDTKFNVTQAHTVANNASPDLVTTSSYNTFGEPLRITDPRGNATTFAYDAAGNLTTRTDPSVDGSTHTTTWAYNARGQVTSKTDPTGVVETHTYDETGKKALLTSELDPAHLALTTTLTYDAIGNVTTTKDPNGNIASVTYSPTRKVLTETLPVPATGGIAPKTTRSYDVDDRPILVTNTVDATRTVSQRTTYTPTGKVATVTVPAATITASTPVTTNVYDAVDRVSQVTDPAGRVSATTYYKNGLVATVTRGVGSSIEVVEATYTYTTNNDLSTITDANGNKTSYFYDAYDRRYLTRYPSATTEGTSDTADYEQVTFDAAGNVLTRRTRGAETFSHTYDALNRLRTQSGGGLGAVDYDFDAAGRPTATRYTDGSHSIAYTYDTAGRATKTADSVGAVERDILHAYDKAGNLTRLTWPDGYYITYAYDHDNRLTTVAENGATSIATYTYDALSRRATYVRGGITTSYVYNPTGTIYQIQHNPAGTADDVTLTYAYNNDNQVTGVWSSNAGYVFAPGAATSAAYTTNGLNQYTAIAGAAQIYSADGDLATDDGGTYTHNALNQLSKAVVGSTTATYAYDPLRRRASKTVNGTTSQVLFSEVSAIADYNASNALVRRYIPGPALDEPIAIVEGSAKRFLLADRNRSVIGVTNATGTVTQKRAYDPFGHPGFALCQASAASCTTLGWNGRPADAETALVDLRSRMYSPATGRFLEPDSIGYGDGTNLYAYAHGDPVNRVDPMGTDSQGGEAAPAVGGGGGAPESATQTFFPDTYVTNNYAEPGLGHPDVELAKFLAEYAVLKGVGRVAVAGVRLGAAAVDELQLGVLAETINHWTSQLGSTLGRVVAAANNDVDYANALNGIAKPLGSAIGPDAYKRYFSWDPTLRAGFTAWQRPEIVTRAFYADQHPRVLLTVPTENVAASILTKHNGEVYIRGTIEGATVTPLPPP